MYVEILFGREEFNSFYLTKDSSFWANYEDQTAGWSTPNGGDCKGIPPKMTNKFRFRNYRKFAQESLPNVFFLKKQPRVLNRWLVLRPRPCLRVSHGSISFAVRGAQQVLGGSSHLGSVVRMTPVYFSHEEPIWKGSLRGL